MMAQNNSEKHIIVIGGGAAGMFAAVTAARAGARVTLLEKNGKLGKRSISQARDAVISQTTADLRS